MTDLVATLGRQGDGKSSITPLVGTFVSFDATGYQVDVGGGRIPAQLGSSYLPIVNENVWVWFVDGQPFIMGPTTPRPGAGTVVSVASGLVTVSTVVGNFIMPYTSTLSPTAGQVLNLVWGGGWAPTNGFATSVASTSPTGGVAPPAGGGGGITHVDTFTAIDAGSFQSGNGWWTGTVRAGDTNLGAWFYGTKIPDTLPASASIGLVQVYVSAQQISGSAPNFALHPHASKPGGSPSLSSSTPVGIAPGWVTLPSSFGNALRAGGGSFGIGLNHGGNNILRSLAQDGQSGALRITSVY
jgi:hypothetical protein